MLKINKILSKKIKFTLSLRGAKQRSNRKGFSLIELMVAVVILAMVVFGIFLAFSTGFQGMADARDRTEAVNYIQKTLEEYKNTSFNKIIDKPMRQIAGTKFSNGSIVIDISEPGEETRLKKIITQVRWNARNGNIKIEEASTIIYSAEKTGELLSASEIVLYASPYFRILPNTSTNLFAEIHDANGNIVTDKSYTINFVILGENDLLGELVPESQTTSSGIASVEYRSFEDSDGSESIQASADLDGDGSDDVFDTITITISIGAEGIILEHASEFYPVEDPVEIDLYIVDASFNFESGIFEGYTDPIILNATDPATLSVNSITAPDGTASFTLYSNGTPGTVEIIASAPDLDLGYTEVTFTGGAESIQLTPKDGSIYEGGSIEITITILDENLNQTPYSGSITITSSDPEGSFDLLENSIVLGFDTEGKRTVNFSSSNLGTVIITASGTDFENDVSINLEVLESLTPSYIELKAVPTTGVFADGSDCSVITATVYDDSNPSEIVTNYTTLITFSVPGVGVGYFLDGDTPVATIDVDPSHGEAWVSLYSDSSGTVTVTVDSGGLAPKTINITFYSSASYLLLATNSDSVVANGEDYAVITATVYDTDGNIVTNYLYDILFSVFGVGSLGDENPITPTNGIAQVNLYSYVVGTATVDAFSHDLSQPLTLEADAINIEFTPPQDPGIQLLEDTVIAYGGFKIITFEVEVANADLQLESMLISWTDTVADLNKIEIASPTSEMNYVEIYDGTNNNNEVTVENISTTSQIDLLIGNSTFKLTFDNNMNNESITIILYDVNEIEYILDVITI